LSKACVNNFVVRAKRRQKFSKLCENFPPSVILDGGFFLSIFFGGKENRLENSVKEKWRQKLCCQRKLIINFTAKESEKTGLYYQRK
jgi:hypothetical protein